MTLRPSEQQAEALRRQAAALLHSLARKALLIGQGVSRA